MVSIVRHVYPSLALIAHPAVLNKLLTVKHWRPLTIGDGRSKTSPGPRPYYQSTKGIRFVHAWLVGRNGGLIASRIPKEKVHISSLIFHQSSISLPERRNPTHTFPPSVVLEAVWEMWQRGPHKEQSGASTAERGRRGRHGWTRDSSPRMAVAAR